MRWYYLILCGAGLIVFLNYMVGRPILDLAPVPAARRLSAPVVTDFAFREPDADAVLVPPPVGERPLAEFQDDVARAGGALESFALCLDDLAGGAPFAMLDPEVRSSRALDAPALYRHHCAYVVNGAAWGYYRMVYGARAEAFLHARLAEEVQFARLVLGSSQGAQLQPDAVWMAAFGRAAGAVRGFHEAQLAVYHQLSTEPPLVP